MTLSVTDLDTSRAVIGRLLDELGVDAYLFEVEPRDGQWQVRVECAIEEGWEALTLDVSKDDLLRSQDDTAIRERLLSQWEQVLVACKREHG